MFILVLVILFSTLFDGFTALIAVFFAGLVVDLWNGNTLGITSAIYVSVAFILNVYKRKYNPEHLVFLLPFTLLVASMYSWFYSDKKFILSSMRSDLLYSGISLVIVWILIRLWHAQIVSKKE